MSYKSLHWFGAIPWQGQFLTSVSLPASLQKGPTGQCVPFATFAAKEKRCCVTMACGATALSSSQVPVVSQKHMAFEGISLGAESGVNIPPLASITILTS